MSINAAALPIPSSALSSPVGETRWEKVKHFAQRKFEALRRIPQTPCIRVSVQLFSDIGKQCVNLVAALLHLKAYIPLRGTGGFFFEFGHKILADLLKIFSKFSVVIKVIEKAKVAVGFAIPASLYRMFQKIKKALVSGARGNWDDCLESVLKTLEKGSDVGGFGVTFLEGLQGFNLLSSHLISWIPSISFGASLLSISSVIFHTKRAVQSFFCLKTLSKDPDAEVGDNLLKKAAGLTRPMREPLGISNGTPLRNRVKATGFCHILNALSKAAQIAALGILLFCPPLLALGWTLVGISALSGLGAFTLDRVSGYRFTQKPE